MPPGCPCFAESLFYELYQTEKENCNGAAIYERKI